MKQVRFVLEKPRDQAYSKLHGLQHLHPTKFVYNFNIVYEQVFLSIDESLTSAIEREINSDELERV